jgi:hypothetical protein
MTLESLAERDVVLRRPWKGEADGTPPLGAELEASEEDEDMAEAMRAKVWPSCWLA